MYTYKYFHQDTWQSYLCIMMLDTQHPVKHTFTPNNSSASSNPILISTRVCLAHKLFQVLYFASYLFNITLPKNHTPFSCSPKLFNNYSQNRELVLIPVFTLQFCYMSYIGVMFEFLFCSPEIPHVIFPMILWWLLKTLFLEKTLALCVEELLEVEKEFELYPAETVSKVNYYCLQLCSWILLVSVHLDTMQNDTMHIKTHSVRGQKLK